jgi:DNA-binding NarL/FixJ family response regulator
VKKSRTATNSRKPVCRDLPKQRARSSTPVKTVFIVEDHPVFRQGLAQMLEAEQDLSVCGCAEDAESAIGAISRLKPDLVLIDLTLPGKSGLELIKEIRSSNTKAKLLVVSMHDEALYADRVLRAGGDGYVMKQEAPDEIVHAIRDVLGGHLHVSEAVLGKPRRPLREGVPMKNHRLDQLTDLELEVLELVGRGRPRAEIARELKLGASIVSAQCLQIRKKMRFRTASELLRYAVCWVETGTL